MKLLRFVWFILLLCTISLSCSEQPWNGHQAGTPIPDHVDYNFHVKPILSDRCYKCHGPDEKARKANLRLDLEAFAFAPLDSLEEHFAIVPGDLKKSELVRRITHEDPEERMPPEDSNLSLSDTEIEILKRWILQGAEWKPHWAFIPPEKTGLPKVSDPKWPRNGIDHFVMARFDQENLRPSPEASKEKLIRRLSFDLRGLPPDTEEIDDFLADDSPAAYEKLADRFLSQESCGERLALEWLDLARYADSHGYQDDLERSMWPWRDWVIDAFNRNMPYDQFVTWQLAGDLIPNASYEQKLATGFNRNHKITQEVGVVDEEYRVEYVLDRVNTFSTAFLGLTVACAQCHDHKFDPISQKEFYSLFGFFNNVPERGRVEYNVEVADPVLPLPQETVDKYRNYIANLVSTQQKEVEAYENRKWEENTKGKDPGPKMTGKTEKLPGQVAAYYPLDYIENGMTREEARGNKMARVINGLVPVAGKFSGALEFNSKNYLDLGPSAELDFRRPFAVSFWLYSINGGVRGPVLTTALSGPEAKTGLEFSVSSNKNFYIRINGLAKNSGIVVVSREELPPDRWVNVVLCYDGASKAKGVQLYMNGKPLEVIIERDELRGTVPAHKKVFVGVKRGGKNMELVEAGFVSGRMDEILFFNRKLDAEEVEALFSFNPLEQLTVKKNTSEVDKKRLLFHQLHHSDVYYQELTERLREYKIREVRMEDVILKPTMVMADMDTIRPTYVLDRGQYNAPAERVYPGTPKHVLPFSGDLPDNRMGLARWLFDDDNPLTARVAVNRYWQMIFGRGIVATTEDFGSQGQLPTHPGLLDWLAIEFVESGWDVKQLLKIMVMSATYRQSASMNPTLEKRDPDNLLLARGPQFRLPAEMIRDQALAISGLLNPQIGGPSVKPYHPNGLWLEASSGNQPLRKYIQDHGGDLYRRSMYTFWKRTVPPPSMMTFDASSREQCLVRRQVTSTPMQALVLLNDPQIMEASRLIAERMMTQGGDDTKARISFVFRLATSRRPAEKELQLLMDLFDKEKANFEDHPESAQKLLGIGEHQRNTGLNLKELAAYTIVANTILNLSESVRKG